MEEDRISQLPDPVLQQILSLIDINEAVQTTILSKRWKNLWHSLSDLHFHLSHLCSPDLVSHFLSHRDAAATVRTFHLSFNRRLDQEFVDECVHYAINHGVQSLRLRAPDCSPPLKLPAAFFTSETLRELELRHFSSGIYLPPQFCLPHLKTLCLEYSVFISGGRDSYTVLNEPLSCFPELEKLTLRCYMVSGLVVKAPKLRFLEIGGEKLMMKEISAPLLTWFRYEGSLPLECSKVNLPVLEEVYLDICKRWSDEGMHLKCVKMLHQLGNATTVSLTLDTLKVLAMDGGLIEQSPPPFPYIKCLKLVKGCREIRLVLQSMVNYLTVGTLYYKSSLMVEFPPGVSVIEENSVDLFDYDDIDYEPAEFDLFD